MSNLISTSHANRSQARNAAIDRLRGAAVALMMIDHVMLVTGLDPLLRWGPTRLALPMFALLAGHFTYRVTWSRFVSLVVPAVLLPVFVPWIDDPNVLLLLCTGMCFVEVARRVAWFGPTLVLACGLLLANGVDGQLGTGYPLVVVVLLVALGMYVPFDWLASFAHNWLPSWRWLAALGRNALFLYVAHLLVLEGIRLCIA